MDNPFHRYIASLPCQHWGQSLFITGSTCWCLEDIVNQSLHYYVDHTSNTLSVITAYRSIYWPVGSREGIDYKPNRLVIITTYRPIHCLVGSDRDCPVNRLIYYAIGLQPLHLFDSTPPTFQPRFLASLSLRISFQSAAKSPHYCG